MKFKQYVCLGAITIGQLRSNHPFWNGNAKSFI
jgi:hypothetical protein